MNLNSKDKRTIEGIILNRVGGGLVPTKVVVEDVWNSVFIQGCEKSNVSGIISGMNKRNMINCKGGFCWLF